MANNEFVYCNATDGYYNVTRDVFTGGIQEVEIKKDFWSDVVTDTEDQIMSDWYELLCEAERSEYEIV